MNSQYKNRKLKEIAKLKEKIKEVEKDLGVVVEVEKTQYLPFLNDKPKFELDRYAIGTEKVNSNVYKIHIFMYEKNNMDIKWLKSIIIDGGVARLNYELKKKLIELKLTGIDLAKEQV